MLTHPSDPRLFLAEVSDFRAESPPERLLPYMAPLRVIQEWAQGYLCGPHAELGRSGPVCPFTRPSLRRELFYLAIYPGNELDQAQVREVVRAYRDWFMEMEPTSGAAAAYKTVGIVFPDLNEDQYVSLIEDTQDALKSDYVHEGLMIGEFHPGPPSKGGLRNPDFRPLRSPLPLLSIRHMVPTDFAFLHDRRDWMESYLARFAGQVPNGIADEVRGAAEKWGFEYVDLDHRPRAGALAEV
jgi:hypothetical protein